MKIETNPFKRLTVGAFVVVLVVFTMDHHINQQ
jgi:hypothetical protein